MAVDSAKVEVEAMTVAQLQDEWVALDGAAYRVQEKRRESRELLGNAGLSLSDLNDIRAWRVSLIEQHRRIAAQMVTLENEIFRRHRLGQIQSLLGWPLGVY